MTQRLARLLVVAILAVACPAAVSAAATDDATRTAVAALNQARAHRGLEPLVERSELSTAAGRFARDMARRRSLSLHLPGAVPLREQLERAGYVPAASRMLLTAGYPDPELLIESLLGDDSSVEALLDPQMGEIGFGHAPGPYRTADGTVITHTWLLILGQTRVAPVVDPIDRLLAAINRARKRRGVAPVEPAPALDAAARDHARDMIDRGYFDHHSPEGGDVTDRARRKQYDFSKIGENLAVGQMTPDEVVQAWHDSPGHARVLYDPDLRDVGIGYLPGPLRRRPQTFNHLWVAVFGVRQ